MDLKNKTALVTGATSGLGLEIAKLLVENECKVFVLGRTKDKVELSLSKIKSPLATGIVCDLSDFIQIKEVFTTIDNLDILINCAGVIAYNPIEKHDPKNIKNIIDVNLLGTIYCSQFALKIMKKNNYGSIVNVSSTSGLPTGGNAFESVYMASKFGVQGFTEGIKKELKEEKSKVRMLGFYPGGMNTSLFAKAGLDKDTSEFMDPKEIAEIIIFIIQRSESIKMDHIVVNRNK